MQDIFSKTSELIDKYVLENYGETYEVNDHELNGSVIKIRCSEKREWKPGNFFYTEHKIELDLLHYISFVFLQKQG